MRVIYSEDHKLRDAKTELHGGQLVTPFEGPFRAEWILEAVTKAGFSDVVAPERFGLETALKVHDAGYLDFLSKAWDLWKATGAEGEAIPTSFPVRRSTQRVPRDIDALLGYYANAAETAITSGTYEAAIASMQCALTGADWLNSGNRFAFSLCRPPGHHAGSAFAGGYCYINNAAVAAQWLRDNGAKRVSILDVDYHHGNGTQEIFYARADVQVLNLHADPMQEYPYFLGHADEKGAGDGEGFNLNYPMPFGTSWAEWNASLEDACSRLAAYAPDVVVVSLGVDTFERDPISKFKLKTEDFPKIGARIAALGLPTLFVMEGGYAVEEIGVNAVGVLTGFEGA